MTGSHNPSWDSFSSHFIGLLDIRNLRKRRQLCVIESWILELTTWPTPCGLEKTTLCEPTFYFNLSDVGHFLIIGDSGRVKWRETDPARRLWVGTVLPAVWA